MSELGDALELLHGAAGRVTTLTATLLVWYDEERGMRAAQAAQQRASDGSVAVLYHAGKGEPPHPASTSSRRWSTTSTPAATGCTARPPPISTAATTCSRSATGSGSGPMWPPAARRTCRHLAITSSSVSWTYPGFRPRILSVAGRGSPEGRPAVELVLLSAYCIGVRSSRQIERRLNEDITFRVLAANQLPNHVTIARFRARHEQALAGFLVQSLRLCAAAGMVRVGTVALDGTKLAANASPVATVDGPA